VVTVSKAKAPISPLAELFRPYAIPPTPAVQEAARQEGWVPPWDREFPEIQKKEAGKRSGAMRAGLAGIRRSLVREAHALLGPTYRLHPFSIYSIEALRNEYLRLLDPTAKNLGVVTSCMLAALSDNDRQVLRKVKRETLIKDLKVLGIRSKPKKQRVG
jgi:hypothetical protein